MTPPIFGYTLTPEQLEIVLQIFSVIWAIIPYVVFFALFFIARRLWIHLKRLQFLANIKWTLIEVRIPKDVFKSPLAMELVLINAIHQGSYGNWYHKYIQGRLPLWFSLEIVSIGGKIYFFIMAPSKYGPFNYKDLIESNIYSQYPQAEINEVPDYTDMVNMEGENSFGVWGTEYALKKDASYGIKTYIDYGVDKAMSLDENQKVDPITSAMELLGSLKEGEQIWIQFLVQASQSRFSDPKKWFGKRGWTDVVKDEITKVKDSLKPKEKGEPAKQLSPGEKDRLALLERRLEKPGFDCGIRALYLAQKGKFRGSNIAGLLGLFKQYSTGSNSISLKNATGTDYPWQDINAYRLRSFFYPPHQKKYVALRKIERNPSVLNSEELATLYHFPSGVAETPTFKRILSKKAEPPTNLPI